MSFINRRLIASAVLSIVFFLSSLFVLAADGVRIRGTVTDALGAVVPNANVELIDSTKASDSQALASTTTDAVGNFVLQAPSAGRYQLRVSAKSFEPAESGPTRVSSSGESRIDVTLFPSAVSQSVSVTATGTAVPLAQVGSDVSILSRDQYRFAEEVQDPLRLMPGLEMSQTGQRGSTASLFVRGGNSDANKVLIDGLPASFVGGFAEFSGITATGVQQVEVLRGPNSALYGSDALSGVVSITTNRGATPAPLLTYSAEGGNFGTYRQEASAGGVFRQFDYFSDYSSIKSSGSLPMNQYRNGSYAGNFGWTPTTETSLRVTARNFGSRVGLPNALELYGIPDDASQLSSGSYLGVTFENQPIARWSNLVRYGRTRLRQNFTDLSPTGTPYLGFETLGSTVTIHGANGYSAAGQAVYQYFGTYPSSSLNTTNRDFVYAQSQYRFTSHLNALVGLKYENERGLNQRTGSYANVITRGNYSYSMQLGGDFFNRLYYTLGSGIEDNALFGVEATPRASIAYHLFRPASGLFSGTKLRFSFGKGIKEPSIGQETTSLYNVLMSSPTGPNFIAQHGISPVGAQNSRNYDGGIDQELANGRAKVGVSYFHNQFTNVVEYVPQAGLIALGVPASGLSGIYGAYVNSQAFRTQGVEAQAECKLTKDLYVRGGYTYLDAVVQRSFSSDALEPSYNPNIPGIAIGAYSPLKGQRPFRRAPHSGYFGINYERSRWFASLTGTLVGRRDDSTYLLMGDKDGGNTLLLPNRNLAPAYQRLDLSTSYRVSRSLTLFTTIQNLLSQRYDESFGYRAMPLSFRSGVKLSFGGESWKLH